MVVLNRQANSSLPKGGSLTRGSNQEDDPSNGSNEGYWAYLRRVISYMNPLSYLAGTSNSSETSQESHDSMWQYGELLFSFSYYYILKKHLYLHMIIIFI